MVDGFVDFKEKKQMKKLTISAIFAVLIFAAAVSVSAQQSKLVFKGTATNKNGIKFSDWEMILVKNKPLKTTARPINVLQAHSYLFKASKGRSFFVEINSKEPTTIFALIAPDGTQITASDAEGTAWEGEIETDGEYKLVVSTDKKSSYTLNVKIN